MNPFKRHREPELDRQLRGARPEPRDTFVDELVGRIEERKRPRRALVTSRVAFATGLAAAMLIAAASVGGFGYAATAARSVVHGVTSVLASNDGGAIASNFTASSDQYRPGFGWGDPGANHGGPPGVERPGGDFAPPLVADCKSGGTAVVHFAITLDEQADLTFTVFGKSGKKLPFADPSGETTKKLDYRVLVPRVLHLKFTVPCDLLADGQTYLVHIQATDPDGNSSTLDIPFGARGATT